MTDFAYSPAIRIGIDAYANGILRLPTAVNTTTRLAELLRNLSEETANLPHF